MKHLRLSVLLAGAVASEGAAFVLLVVVVLLSHLNGTGPAVDGRSRVLLGTAAVLAALPLAVAGGVRRRRAYVVGAVITAAVVVGVGYALAALL